MLKLNYDGGKQLTKNGNRLYTARREVVSAASVKFEGGRSRVAGKTNGLCEGDPEDPPTPLIVLTAYRPT
ncbi:MAG TPA: hypothetical protein VKS60_17565 [Stellaceae bacterium]|nr:hypothetical protein [Stellaceae bacterium]